MGSDATQPIKRLGAWAAKSVNTIYQAATDGYVVYNYTDAAVDTVAIGETDSATPPTVERGGGMTAGHANPKRIGLSFFVRKGDYWDVTNTGGTPDLFWIPLEP